MASELDLGLAHHLRYRLVEHSRRPDSTWGPDRSNSSSSLKSVLLQSMPDARPSELTLPKTDWVTPQTIAMTDGRSLIARTLSRRSAFQTGQERAFERVEPAIFHHLGHWMMTAHPSHSLRRAQPAPLLVAAGDQFGAIPASDLDAGAQLHPGSACEPHEPPHWAAQPSAWKAHLPQPWERSCEIAYLT